MKTPEERLTDLEIRYTEQERLLQALDEVVRAQQDELERQAASLLRLTDKLSSVEGSQEEQRDLADEKPPHY